MDIESTSLRMRTATAIKYIDQYAANNHCTEPTRLMSTYEVRVGSEERARDLAGGGRRGHRHACGDRTVHASQRKSVAGRAGAVDGLLHHVGGTRLGGHVFWTQGT